MKNDEKYIMSIYELLINLQQGVAEPQGSCHQCHQEQQSLPALLSHQALVCSVDDLPCFSLLQSLSTLLMAMRF